MGEVINDDAPIVDSEAHAQLGAMPTEIDPRVLNSQQNKTTINGYGRNIMSPSAIEGTNQDRLDTGRNLLRPDEDDSAPFRDGSRSKSQLQVSGNFVAPNEILMEPKTEMKNEGNKNGDWILRK